MKKFFTQQINFAYAVIVMLTLTLGMNAVFAGFTAPTENPDIDPILHIGGGSQILDQFSVAAPSNLSGVSFDIRGTNTADQVALFDKVSNSSRFYVLNTMNVLKQTFIGSNNTVSESIWNRLQSDGQLQSVNVGGNVRSTALANTTGESLCFDRDGELQRCGSSTIVSGSCGTADGVATSTTPINNLCTTGNQSSVSGGTGTTNYSWTCSGYNGGSNASCSAPYQLNASCNTFSSSYVSQPANASNGCSIGTYSDTSDTSSQWRWQCSGQNGGSDVACNANRVAVINGSCNNSTQNGCSAGTPNDGAVSDTASHYRWRCDGQNGGSNSGTCQINRPVNGLCRIFTGSYSSQPGINTVTGCLAGTYSNTSDTSSQWRWRCLGLNGGLTSSCVANRSGGGGGIGDNPIFQ